MKLSKAWLYISAAAAAFAVTSPASAQRVDRIVAFGDSYADDGNLFELLGIPRPAVYPNGRFSDSTNFVDTMAQLLAVPVDNFAIGGAFTGNGNINGPGIPGFVTEWQSFLAGGGPAAFPRVSGTFDADDLAVVSIGGNDARAYERSLGLTPSTEQIQGLIAGVPAQATQRVAEATAGLNALVNAGARNITFLAGDVGRLPEVRGLPVAAVGSAYATAFNTGMKASLANLADQGVIVNFLDLNLIGDRVEQNLAAFGLTSAGACPIACLTTNPELLSRHLFYVDQVHLTSAGFAIVGRYAVRQLEAPLHLQGQADAGLQSASSFGSTMLGRLDLADARFGAASEGGLRFYVSGNTASVTRDDAFRSLGYELDTFGATAGAEYEGGGGIILGAAGNYSRSEADMDSGTGRAKATAWQLGLYGGWSGGGAFVEGYAGYGWVEYDIDRRGVIDDLAASPDGTAVTAGAQAGYLLDLGGARVGPVIGLRYAEADIDAYSEAGDAALTLNVQEQELRSLLGSAGIEARGTFDAGGLAVRPYAAAALEREFEGDARTIRYALTAAPGIVNQWVLPERSDDLYGRVTAGMNLDLGSSATLQLNASTSISRDDGNDIAGFLALRLSL
ncbi:MAG TPA: autotransporter domain-containing protein [Allosphingosinicella sp.]|nr:autotransporter domain-containing protein [Allosphingosinicella sp.]